MSLHIVLDSSPLSALAQPKDGDEVKSISQWVRHCLASGHSIYIPEIIDYELRRELIRSSKTRSLSKLDLLSTTLHYLPITTSAMLRAADLWAWSRNSGQPTGDPAKLDIDTILAAQTLTLDAPEGGVVVVTANVGHLSRFVRAELWSDIEV